MNVLYIVGEFPALSETFIRDELLSHISAGIDVSIFARRAPKNVEVWDNHSVKLRQNVAYVRPQNWMGEVAQVGSDILAELKFRKSTSCLPVLLAGCRSRVGGRLSAYYGLQALRKLESQPDIIHCHFGTNGLPFATIKELGLTRSKLVTTFHGADLSSLVTKFGASVYERLFRWGDLFLPVSEYWRRELIRLGCDPGKIAVQRMGVDCESFQPVMRQEPNMPTRFVAVGRLVEKKGHIYSLRALARLSRHRPEVSWKLDLIGGGVDEKALRLAANELGISAAVTFHGPISHTKTLELMRRGDIFVLPSVTAENGDMEGIPVALMEASAMGLPVITTYHSGIPELVCHGESGLLSAERDVEGLAANLETMLDHPERWPSFGQAGRQRVGQYFNRAKLASNLQDHYRGLLTDSRAAA